MINVVVKELIEIHILFHINYLETNIFSGFPCQVNHFTLPDEVKLHGSKHRDKHPCKE